MQRRLLQLEVDLLSLNVEYIVSGKPKQKCLRESGKLIQNIAVQLGLSAGETRQVWANSYSRINELYKKSFNILHKKGWKDKLDSEKRDTIYQLIRARIQNNDLIKQSNKVMFGYEFRMKHESIYGEDGILATAKSPFFLCSSHPKPAKDHKDYEGKMYYDEDWESKNDYTPEQKRSIRAYIRNHSLMSVQWVVGPEVYLTTRRNCKHYFKNLPLNEVLHASAKSLLKKHNMYMRNEESVSRDILMYREYYNRMKIENALYANIECPTLRSDLHKDRILLDKWTKMINNKDVHNT